MTWPQFELWRLLAAAGLFAAATGCHVVRDEIATNFVEALAMVLVGLGLLGASIGVPFKKGISLGIGLPLVLFFLFKGNLWGACTQGTSLLTNETCCLSIAEVCLGLDLAKGMARGGIFRQSGHECNINSSESCLFLAAHGR